MRRAEGILARTRGILAALGCAALLLSACGPSGKGPQKAATQNQDEVSAGVPAPPIAAAELGAPATPDQKALYEGDFEAVGSEPDWRLDLLSDWAAFTRPGLSDVGGLPAAREYRAQGARVVAGPLTIVLKYETCAHEGGGMFPYRAIVNYEGVAYEGCARRGADQAAKDSDWTSLIGQLIPAIDACLARADKKPARVTIAYLLDGGQASVRLRDSEGGRWECNAPITGGAVSYWDTIGDRNTLQGEGDPEFVRAPTAPPPAGSCRANTQAKGPNGAVLGWYTRKTC